MIAEDGSGTMNIIELSGYYLGNLKPITRSKKFILSQAIKIIFPWFLKQQPQSSILIKNYCLNLLALTSATKQILKIPNQLSRWPQKKFLRKLPRLDGRVLGLEIIYHSQMGGFTTQKSTGCISSQIVKMACGVIS